MKARAREHQPLPSRVLTEQVRAEEGRSPKPKQQSPRFIHRATPSLVRQRHLLACPVCFTPREPLSGSGLSVSFWTGNRADSTDRVCRRGWLRIPIPDSHLRATRGPPAHASGRVQAQGPAPDQESARSPVQRWESGSTPSTALGASL